MAETKHAIVRTDNMSATRDGSLLVSGRYYGSGSELTEIDNGNLVVIGDYDTDEREVRKCTTPATDSDISTLGIVVTPELIYDESRHHGLEEYYNEKGEEILVMRLHANDFFSVTAEAIDGSPEKGKFLVSADSTKLKVSDSGEDGTLIGKIAEVETVGADTYYGVQVTM